MVVLSNLEKDRLIHRDAQNPNTRATNDTRVRKKLKAWMSEILDVMYILEYLPENQLNDVVIDDDVRDLMFISLMAASIKKNGPITGELKKPENWRIIETTKPLKSWPDLRREASLISISAGDKGRVLRLLV
jgi:hypothetical protein